MVRRDGFEPPMFTLWVADLQSAGFSLLPTYAYVGRDDRYRTCDLKLPRPPLYH